MSRHWTILQVVRLYWEKAELDSAERRLIDDILVELSRLYEIEFNAVRLAKYLQENTLLLKGKDEVETIIALYERGNDDETPCP